MEFYQVSNEDKVKIRELFNVTEEDVEAQMSALKEWVKTMSHFPQYSHDEDFLYAMLVRSKFNEKNVNKYLENCFNGVIKYAKVFQNLGKFKASEEIGMAVPSPKLTRNFERVIILKFIPQNMTKKTFDVRQLVLIAVTTGTFLYTKENAARVRFLVDLKGLTMMHLLKLNTGIADLFKFASIIQNVLSLRSSGFEIINSPRLVHALLTIIRVIVKPKLFLRITVHSDVISLSKNIPLESLPSDYGGECESTEMMLEKWDKTVEENQSFFETVASWSLLNSINEDNKS